MAEQETCSTAGLIKGEHEEEKGEEHINGTSELESRLAEHIELSISLAKKYREKFDIPLPGVFMCIFREVCASARQKYAQSQLNDYVAQLGGLLKSIPMPEPPPLAPLAPLAPLYASVFPCPDATLELEKQEAIARITDLLCSEPGGEKEHYTEVVTRIGTIINGIGTGKRPSVQ